MAKSKKVVLFLVEGITDEISLALVLSKIIEKDKLELGQGDRSCVPFPT